MYFFSDWMKAINSTVRILILIGFKYLQEEFIRDLLDSLSKSRQSVCINLLLFKTRDSDFWVYDSLCLIILRVEG